MCMSSAVELSCECGVRNVALHTDLYTSGKTKKMLWTCFRRNYRHSVNWGTVESQNIIYCCCFIFSCLTFCFKICGLAPHIINQTWVHLISFKCTLGHDVKRLYYSQPVWVLLNQIECSVNRMFCFIAFASWVIKLWLPVVLIPYLQSV